MADSKKNAEVKTRRSWLKVFFRAGILLLLLLVVAYFVVTSNAFIQGVVIPRAGRAINSKLTVSDVEFSPFTHLVLHEVKLTPNGTEPLLAAKLIRARYSLLSILRGNIVVEEVSIELPLITLVENADGTGNLDAFKFLSTGTAKSGGVANHTASAPPRIAFKTVALKNATIRSTRNFKNGEKVVAEFSNLNVTASDIRNGASGKLDWSGGLSLDKITASPPSLSSLQAMLNGGFTFELLDDLRPGKVKGLASFSVGRATGEFSDLNVLLAKLDCEITPSEVKQFALHFDKSGKSLGEVRVNGPFDIARSEGKLKAEISSIDRRVLNLLGAASGIDFGSTTINASSDIEFARGGSSISSAGRVEVSRFQIKRQGQSTPALDLRCDYGVAVDRAAQTALLSSVILNGTQNARALVQGELSSPMAIAWGGAGGDAGDATLTFALTDLNLADWKAFTGDAVPEGLVSAKLKLTSQQGGKQLSLQIGSTTENLSIGAGQNAIRVGELGFNGSVTNETEGQFVNGTLSLRNVTVPGANASPLEASLIIDASLAKSVAELRQCVLKLTPTSRATNELALTGAVDLSDMKAITGKLKFVADALDATGCYDLFDTKSKKAETTTTQPASTAPAAGANKEPAPVKLPLHNFVVEANIGRLFLRNVDAANFQTAIRLDSSRVLLKPFQLTLNNAPITATADVDLSVPGYKYDVAFRADGVPLAPLADSFSPTYRGKAEGTFIANIELKGAGVTGVNMKKSLSGKCDLNFTNANIQIVGKIIKPVVTVVATLLNAPELLKSPLDYLTTSIRVGDGKMEIPTFVAQSAALHIESPGTIPIADVLMDSPLNQPVEVSLARDIANKLSFANTPTNVAYVKLPDFVKLKGTLGNVDPKTDKAKLAGLTAIGIGAGLINVGGEGAQKVGGALNALGGLLGAKPAAPVATNSPPDAAGTNAPAAANTNQSKPGSLLDLFKKPKK